MYPKEKALNDLYRLVLGVREALRMEDADPEKLSVGLIQTAQLTLVNLDKTIPPSLLCELAELLAERGRLGSEFGDAETIPAQRYLPGRN